MHKHAPGKVIKNKPCLYKLSKRIAFYLNTVRLFTDLSCFPPDVWTMHSAYVWVYFALWRRGSPMDATKPKAVRPPTRRRGRLLRDERGSIVIEFALIGPIFLMLMLGI